VINCNFHIANGPSNNFNRSDTKAALKVSPDVNYEVCDIIMPVPGLFPNGNSLHLSDRGPLTGVHRPWILRSTAQGTLIDIQK